MVVLKRVALLMAASLAAALPVFAGDARPAGSAPAGSGSVEVVAVLDAPPLARAGLRTQSLQGARSRVDLRAPASRSYLRGLASAQRALQARIGEQIPGALVRRHYAVVVNGMSVVLPRSGLGRLERIEGVARVYPSLRYRSLRSSSPGFIGATALWGPGLASAGNGVKIGIVDDGLDRTHPFLSARGYRMPAGYPKGVRKYTSAKVIAARAFAPRSPRWPYARRPFDPFLSEHATHVAGIAAGNYRTSTGSRRISGVAPKAYLGNYKVLSVPTVSGFGLNGNSPEIVAGIEAAVRDGMDVINLSLGEAEIEPGRDIVATALDGAAAAGVVPVVAAGNDFSELGFGSVTSPANSERAITVAAESETGPTIASFSSGGPTPISLRMKPDVTAPGEKVLSSIPRSKGLWALFSGTSMAAPHVAGGAALLHQRHPTWTVEQIKSALVQTGDPVRILRGVAAPATREGGGSINLVRADTPLLFAAPSSLAFGFVAPGGSAVRGLVLSDAGGGAGTWSVTVEPSTGDPAVSVAVPPAVTVPGGLPVTVAAGPGAAEAEHSGFVVLSRGAERRRVPFWFRVAAPALGRAAVTQLARTGTYRGNTRGRPALVDTYRYPDNPGLLGVTRFLHGPEQVFRVSLTRPVANFGVAVLARRGRVEPRIVRAGDENRLLGEVALPFNANPYLRNFQEPMPVAGVALPGAGDYDVVFDSATASGAGPFTFRFWIGDSTPPRLRLAARSVRRGGVLQISAVDRGAGVDPRTLHLTVDGRARPASYAARRRLVLAQVRGLHRGRHRLVLTLSDYQESKNMENVPRILPNTAVLKAAFRVR